VKKLLTLVLSLTLLVSVVLPTTVLAVTSGSSVTVSIGGGAIPVVKCKWEQQPVADFAELEDGDPKHLIPGFQILPPLAACTKKMIEYYAVVTDEEDGGNVSQVFVDVYHPTGSPEPYGKSKVGGVPKLPYFKYEVPFTKLGHSAAEIALVSEATKRGLITFGSAFTLSDVIFELEKGTADLWKGSALIDYEQPAGKYGVHAFAVDANNNLSVVVFNQFDYIAVAGIEVDFTGIEFGSVNLGVEKMIPGDTNWNKTPGINGATVRNIGNTWASVKVKFDDMGFGQDVNLNWNVLFDARMGNDNAYYVGDIVPYKEITLANALGLSKKDELDFSIKILKGFGEHKGVITLGCVARAFEDPVPAWVVGVPSTDCSPD